MKNFRVQHEPNHIENENAVFYLEANNLEEAVLYLKKQGFKFSRYSNFTDTIYYKKL